MDNVGIVVEDLDAAIEFFTELGLKLEGRMPIEGEWSGRVTGLRGQRVEIAMLRTPDGHSRLELSRFDAPDIASDHRTAPVNSLGYLRVMFAVGDIDDTLARLATRGAKVVDEVVDYEGIYRLCYIRGPEGILIGLAQELRPQASPVESGTRTMAKYLISFPSAAMAVSAEEIGQVSRDAHAVIDQAKAAGVYVFAGGIDESVRPVLVSADGTVAEGGYPWAPPLDGGFCVLEVPSREGAVMWAARIAKACRSSQELRVFQYDPES
jgi:catechol 2,3-dioxygenase-like lactoylglutathione lyase family enzyme